MNKCKHNLININNYLIIPFGITKEIDTLMNYFLYKVPSIESLHSKEIDFNDHQAFMHFIKDVGFKTITFIDKYNDNIYKKYHLYGDKICIKCPRIVMNRLTEDNKLESYLESLLRHLRNSIAHGGFYYLHDNKRNYMLFEDRNTNNITSRIVVNKQILKRLKSTIIRYQKGSK